MPEEGRRPPPLGLPFPLAHAFVCTILFSGGVENRNKLPEGDQTVPSSHLAGWRFRNDFLIFGLLWASLVVQLEKAMAPHSSTLAWKIPWTEEPGGLQSMGSRRVGHDCATSLSLFTFMHWRRKWQPTPVFLPGESQRRGSLVGCRLWGHTESDTTEAT